RLSSPRICNEARDRPPGPSGLDDACRQKINVPETGREFEPRVEYPTPRVLDLCFVARGSLRAVIGRLEAAGVAIEHGPVRRPGAPAPLRSPRAGDSDEIPTAPAEPA